MKGVKKLWLCIAILLLIAWTVAIGINLHVLHQSQMHFTDGTDGDKHYDAILVLGAGLKQDGAPSDMLRDRLEAAITLYARGCSDRILLTGDRSGEDYDEVRSMYEYCLSRGIPEEALIGDGEGYSTYESMERAIRDGHQCFLVVTQEYHLYRAVYIARALGADADGFASDYHTYRGQIFRNVREYVARVKDFFQILSNR